MLPSNASSRSNVLTASGAAPRSKSRFTRAMTAPMTGTSDGEISTLSALTFLPIETAIQPCLSSIETVRR